MATTELCRRCGERLEGTTAGVSHECDAGRVELPLEPWARFIPIEEIPLHDRPGPQALLNTVRVLKESGHCPDVRAWLKRVAKIPERE